MMKFPGDAKARLSLAAAFAVEGLESRQLLSAAWSWQDKQIGLDQAFKNHPSITGAGETVVVLDMGVDTTHPAFAGKITTTWNFDTNSTNTAPDGWMHGTGTVGQIAASPHVVGGKLYSGIAPGVKIIALRGTGEANIKAEFDWVIANRSTYNIVALNWLNQGGADLGALQWDLQILHDAGVFMAGAAGNNGPDGSPWSVPGDIMHPVGSVDANDHLSSFTPRGSSLDLVAPGQQVNITYSAAGGPYDTLSDGTSWAGPQVTGTGALIKQINPGFTADQVYQIIRDSATQVYDSYSNRITRG
jgi:hypothetical protein